MTPKPLLSICIPVYNFGKFVGQTLDSITADLPDGVEIVVVDGASTDDTAEVVGRRCATHPQIRYVRLPVKGGIDADMAQSVALASADFCWLFSGDDIMIYGALRKVLRLLADKPEVDVIVCEHTKCDIEMRYLSDYPIFPNSDPRLFDMHQPQQRQDLFRQARCTEPLFSFLSAVVVRKSSWDAGDVPAQFSRSCWAHVSRLMSSACKKSLLVFYPGEVLLHRRGDNDSFADQGLVHRFDIAVSGYLGMATHFYGESSPEAVEVRRMLRNEMGLQEFLFVRSTVQHADGRQRRHELRVLFDRLYGGTGLAGVLKAALFSYFPNAGYLFARRLLHGYRNLRHSIARRTA